jgi:hydrogenase maturation protease
MKTLVIGLGNPILGDDGIGWRVAEAVAKITAGRADVQVECFALGGLSLMEQLTGYEHAVLIDSIHTKTKPIGDISIFPLVELPEPNLGHITAAHDTSLRNALHVGRSMNIPLPEDEAIVVVAIEAEAVYDFSEQLTTPVEASIPKAVEAVLNLLE